MPHDTLCSSPEGSYHWDKPLTSFLCFLPLFRIFSGVSLFRIHEFCAAPFTVVSLREERWRTAPPSPASNLANRATMWESGAVDKPWQGLGPCLQTQHSTQPVWQPDPCSSSEEGLGLSWGPVFHRPLAIFCQIVPELPEIPSLIWFPTPSDSSQLVPWIQSSCVYSSSKPFVQPWQYLYDHGSSQGDQLAEIPALQCLCGSVTGLPGAGKVFSPTSHIYLGE